MIVAVWRSIILPSFLINQFFSKFRIVLFEFFFSPTFLSRIRTDLHQILWHQVDACDYNRGGQFLKSSKTRSRRPIIVHFLCQNVLFRKFASSHDTDSRKSPQPIFIFETMTHHWYTIWVIVRSRSNMQRRPTWWQSLWWNSVITFQSLCANLELWLTNVLLILNYI